MPYNPNRTKNPYSSIEEMIKSVPKFKITPVKLDMIIMKKSTPEDWENRVDEESLYPIFDAEDNYDRVMELATPYKDGYVIHFSEDTFSQCVGLYPKLEHPILSKGHEIKGPRIIYDIEEFHYRRVDMLMFHYVEPCAVMSFALIKGPKAKHLSDIMELDPAVSGKYWNRCKDSAALVHDYLKSNFNIDWKRG